MQATLERLRERREQRGDEGGFTLIELLIVIVILGILAAIVVFAVQNLTGSSAQASCGSDMKTVETAVEAYKAQLADYPGGANVNAAWTQQNPPPAPTFPAGYTNVEKANLVALLSTYSNAGQTIGPWLKDVPNNPGHYTIAVTDTAGTVANVDANGVAIATGCSKVG